MVELSEALDVRPGDLVALVGGGGKTSALYRLGIEVATRGTPVLLTGTTRFTPPEGGDAPNLALAEDEAGLDAAVARGVWPLTVATGWGPKGRLLPIDPRWLERLRGRRPDLTVVVEADGSAMRPFKAPGPHEPVIPETATLVVAVVGLDVVGRRLDEAGVHRPERVAAVAGAALGEAVTPEMIARVLLDRAGGRKGTPAGARWSVLLNKADSPERLAAGERVAALLGEAPDRIVLARLRSDAPVIRAGGRASRGDESGAVRDPST